MKNPEELALKPDCIIERGTFSGVPYAIAHNGIGYRCGYAMLPTIQKFNFDFYRFSVHGGITFQEGFWVGFDCAHSGDAVDPSLPGGRVLWEIHGDEIRSIEYVRAECKSLCEQIAQLRLRKIAHAGILVTAVIWYCAVFLWLA